MNTRWFVVSAFVVPLMCGCRQDPFLNAYIQMSNAEKRALEDRIYQLEYDYQGKVEELEACRRGRADAGPGASSQTTPEIKRILPRRTTAPDTPDLSPPVIEPGIPVPAPQSESSDAPTEDESPPRGDSSLEPSREEGDSAEDGVEDTSSASAGVPAARSRRWTPRTPGSRELPQPPAELASPPADEPDTERADRRPLWRPYR